MTDVAGDEDAAVVVLGSRGRSGLKAALLGSVSYGVVPNTERPVLIVPSPAVALRPKRGGLEA